MPSPNCPMAFGVLMQDLAISISTDIPKALMHTKCDGITFEEMQTTYFLSRRSLQRAKTSELSLWQSLLFVMLSRNADDASRYFHLPADRVVEIGSRQEL